MRVNMLARNLLELPSDLIVCVASDVQAFDIEIPDEEAETMTTPADCVTAIKAKLG